ncbi:MAG: hypothetical protein EBZ77_15175, partial [Chitinophagia bacterium]|nr:hypothetical protein [Chitinophagia bacterium]
MNNISTRRYFSAGYLLLSKYMRMKKRLLITLFSLSALSTAAQYCFPAYQHTGVAAGALHTIHLTGAGSSVLNDTLPAASLASGYANRIAAATTTSLQQGRTYTLHLTYSAAAQLSANEVFIDFNNDNTFAASEAVSPIYPLLLAGLYSGTDIPITLPATAASGTHRMRMRNVVYNRAATPGYSNTNLDPCASSDATNQYNNGVTADYLVNIINLSACSGTPEAGRVTGPTSLCPG